MGPFQPHIQCVLSKGIERKGHEVEHSTSSSAEVKDGGDTPPLPLLLNGVMLN